MKRVITGFLVTMVLLGTLGATAVSAGALDRARGKLDTAIRPTGLERDIETSIGTVVKGILALVGTIFLCLTIYAGILWMTAQGNSEKVDKAKGIVTTAVIGLFITMAAYAITSFVTAKVGGVGSAGSSTSSCQGQMEAQGTSAWTCAAVCEAGQTEVADTDCTAGTICCLTP